MIKVPDYVFEKDYTLPGLDEVEQFVKEHKHLPDMPSAGQIAENGMTLSEMNAALLKKIEELTLYLIEQNKQMQKQNLQIEEQQQQINRLIEKIK